MDNLAELWVTVMESEVGLRVSIAGVVIGALLGALMHRTNFCTMGALSDINAFGDWHRFRAWILAMAVAITGAQGMQYFGFLDLKDSIYLGASFNWLSFIVGGVMFGIGMVFASGCGARNLIRVGGGDLKGLVVVLVVGFSAYMTLRGIIAPARVWLNGLASVDMGSLSLPDTGLSSIVAKLSGLSATTSILVASAGTVLLMLVYCFMDRSFLKSARNVFAGLGIGLLVAAAWWATGVLGADEFEPVPVMSLTFIAPTGQTMQFLMTYTGATINFGIATVFGMLLGSFVSALLAGQFKFNGFADRNDLVRHLMGAVLMGVGGVTALGCTVGQGMSGISTLALGSVLALLAIIAGAFAGFKAMERGFLL